MKIDIFHPEKRFDRFLRIKFDSETEEKEKLDLITFCLKHFIDQAKKSNRLIQQKDIDTAKEILKHFEAIKPEA